MVRRNLVANFGGKFWIALMSFAFIPAHVRMLGLEGYGLLGVLLSLQGLFAVFDFGLSHTITRECARLNVLKQRSAVRTLLLTFETCYWVVALGLGLAIYALAPFIQGWLNYSALSSELARQSLALFALAFALNWPSALYAGALSGLERHVPLNIIGAAAATARNAGGVVVLWITSADLLALLAWHLVVNAATTGALRVSLGTDAGPRLRGQKFDIRALLSSWRFSLGVSGTLALLTILGQLDRIVLSRMYTLDVLAIYLLPLTLTGALGYLAAPITAAFYPRFVHAYAQRDALTLARTFHLCCQFISALVVPAAAILALFPELVLLTWTSNPELARKSAPMLQLLAIAMTISLLTGVFFQVLAAAGLTRLNVVLQGVSVILMGVLLVYLIPAYGPLGAAVAWIVVYSVQATTAPLLTLNRLLPGSYHQWVTGDVLLPSVVSVALTWVSSLLIPDLAGRFVAGAWMISTFLLAASCQLMACSELRPRVLAYLRKPRT